ncbi:unnamed protein product [Nezara viridula]|uniref:Uncharacterized protein n=1 Tax=Nezara viridula TaxID=85310 RepID=A0A9P0E9T9_NEZVI|nr:unnamed protein product [Nezara viridula]
MNHLQEGRCKTLTSDSRCSRSFSAEHLFLQYHSAVPAPAIAMVAKIIFLLIILYILQAKIKEEVNIFYI